ncbi:MAG TPA: ATP-binding protein, partial [Methanomicrobiales archaeon]|nr:ATP-binding protein [Methanomicrobiales archaeon]
RLDGRPVWVEGRGTRSPINGKAAIQIFLRDISARKQAEEGLREYAENLRRSNEDLERFAYISSHDLQEPLRTIVSFSQLLEKRYRGAIDSEADEYIDFIVEAGKRMQHLINDLLEYSRVTTRGGVFMETDSCEILEETLSNLRSMIVESGSRITHDPLPVVMVDPPQLRQVFQNLIANAIKYRSESPPSIHVSAERTHGMWKFSVRDNGIGIEPQYFQKIFVIFQRLHGRDKYEGTGIGLALVKRIIERHGGSIWVESDIGRGSTFYFTLPALEENKS